MSLTVTFAYAPPGWTAPLTFRGPADAARLLRDLGPAFLARHPRLRDELLDAMWALVKEVVA